MKAIILAAGRGSRLEQLTSDQPKCMVEFLGRPLLAWTIETLRAAGITEIAIVGGYRHDMLPQDNIIAGNVIVNANWERSNMVASLLCARDVLRGGDTLISYSDILYHRSVVDALLASSGDIALTYDRRWRELWEVRFNDPLDDAETFREEDGKIIDIGRRPSALDEIEGQYMGLLKFSAVGWRRIERHLEKLPPDAVDRLDMTTLLRALLHEGQTLTAVPVDGRWCEIDSLSDLAKYNERLQQAPARPWLHDWR